MSNESAYLALAEAFRKAKEIFSKNKTVNEHNVIDNNDLSTLDAVYFLINKGDILHEEHTNPEKNTFTLVV